MSAPYLAHVISIYLPQPVARRPAEGWIHRISLNHSGAFRWSDSLVRRFRELTGRGRPDSHHHATWVLPDDLSSVSAGRRLIHAQLAQWHFQGESDVAELLVDELVTNALRHAWGQPVLSLSIANGVLRCAVEDETSELPHAQTPAGCEESGRGLQMVDMLAQRWGADLTRTGKSVWFELRAE